MVVLIIEILLVLTAFGVMVMAGAKMGRQAAALVRASRKMQEHAQPKAAKLAAQADTARELGLRVAEQSELLERRGEVLSITMKRMMILGDAAAEAMNKLNKVTSYLGLWAN